MSEGKPAGDAKVVNTNEVKLTETVTSTTPKSSEIIGDVKPIETPIPKSKGWTNPAFKAMGIPPLRLPSRNWMIFWCVASGLVGGVIYDKYQQKQIRSKWMNRVKHFGEKSLAPNEISRKVTIYIAPPPNDFLEESMIVFRKYIKPILNAGGVDFEIKSEDRQGVIRSTVAANIRELRRQVLQNNKELEELEKSKKWYNRVKNWLSKKPVIDEEALKNKKFTDDWEMKNVLGVFYKNQHKDDKVISEDSLIQDPSGNGGIICIGRGAYKEYLTGLHEGLLGPLEKPIDHKEFEEAKQVKIEPVEENWEAPVVKSIDEVNKDVNVTEVADEPVIEVNNDNPNETVDDEKDADAPLPIPKPFISPIDYSTAEFAPEFQTISKDSKIPTLNKVSPFFQQPIVVFPVFHLNGFLVIPQRIYRFYTRRYLTEEYGFKTVKLVENSKRPFNKKDIDMGKDEEDEWPKKWVKSGKERNSEWTQELVVDDRVIERLSVYDEKLE